MKHWMLLLIVLISSACTIAPPRPTICIHVAEQSKLRCKDPKSGNKFDLTYEESNRYIAISPDDYLDILNFIDELLAESGLRSSTIKKTVLELDN